jgi:hypothetical protein
MKSRFLDTVVSQLDAFQTQYAALVSSSSNETKDGDDELVSTTAQQMQSLWEEHVLSMELERHVSLMSKQSKSKGTPKEHAKEVDEWNQIAIHVVNCAMASVASRGKEKTTATAAALSLMDLIAQWTWLFLLQNNRPNKSTHSVQALLDQIIAFSKCSNQDGVRVLATQSMGFWSRTFWMPLQSSSLSSENRECVTNILDSIQAALLPRFTDKAVAVRAAAITAGIPFYPSDPDFRQAGIWILQHDPSPSNRSLAVKSLPWSISTMDAMIVRLRDVKMQVRLAVLEKLQSNPLGKELFGEWMNDTSSQEQQQNSNLLSPELMAEIVLAGYTDR